MPTRLLYEKITVSVTLAEVTAEEERFFYRLLVKCDDHGRFHAHPAILLGHCFSLQADEISADDVRRWRDRLEEVGLLQTYIVDGREYLSISMWKVYQRQRASSSKFPDPPIRAQSHADVRDRRQMPPVPGDDIRGPEAGDDGRDLRENGAAAPAKAKAATKTAAKSKPTSPPPESLVPNDADYAAGAEVGLSREAVASKTAVMLDHFRGKGELRADWHATFRNWLRNAPKYDQQRAPPTALIRGRPGGAYGPVAKNAEEDAAIERWANGER